MGGDARRLAWWTTVLGAIALLLANGIGAAIVFTLVRWVLPLPDVDDPDAVRLTNVLVFFGYLAFAVPVGSVWCLRRHRPVRRWLASDEPATEEQQRLVLLAPLRIVVPVALLWALGTIVFLVLNLALASKIAIVVTIAAALGGTATTAIAYLLLERILRPAVGRALRPGLRASPRVPGVTGRVLLAWALCSGVPVVGLVLVGGGEIIGLLSASADRLAVTGLVLGSISLVVGLIAIVLSARSVALPITRMRKAMAEVQRGDTDVAVEVDDGSEVGLLQAGFNEMVAGLREREELRDLFGRQVGEEVARQALERGTELGGEVREVGVLFVDVVGSTELAASRPPDEVVALLNEFFRVVVDVVGEHGGWVNKFEGDAALCVFGVPLEREDAAADALAAARELAARLAGEVEGMEAGIGVSYGEAVAGNVGAAERFEYTVIGDPVNEAARLTELAKDVDGRVLASSTALDAAGEQERARWRTTEQVTLRGRARETCLAVPGGGA